MTSCSAVTSFAVVDWRERLRVAVKSSGRKQSAIAEEAGIAPETLSRVLNAVHISPELDTVARIAHAVNENVGWLLDERGFMLSAQQQAKLGEVVAFLHGTLLAAPAPRRAASTMPNSMAVGSQSARKRAREIEIPKPYASIGATVVYRAIGDSMIDAGITEHDLLFVKPERDARAAHGRIVICRLNGAEYAKQLEVAGSHLRLLSRNPRYGTIEIDDDADDFRLIGVVVGRSGPPLVSKAP
jgi:SOS-response transcriptional repressor LexA